MQDVIHVDHTYSGDDMMRAGRDVEKNVLSRALYRVLAQRVLSTVTAPLFCNRLIGHLLYKDAPNGIKTASAFIFHI